MEQKRFALSQQVPQIQMDNLTSLQQIRNEVYIETNNLLRRMLSASNIKHTIIKSRIKLLAFGFKKLQFNSQERVKHCSSKYPLFFKQADESISEIRKLPLRRDHSFYLARQQKPSHISKVKEECMRSFQERQGNKKSQLLEEIVGRLEGINTVNYAQKEETRQYGEFGMRIANLQRFMKKIKRQRAQNDYPAVVIQKTIVPRVNSQKLLMALELEKKRASQSKDREMIQALQKVKKELQKVKQSQQKLLLIPSQFPINHLPEKSQEQLSQAIQSPEQSPFFDKYAQLERKAIEIKQRAASEATFSIHNRRFTFSFEKQR